MNCYSVENKFVFMRVLPFIILFIPNSFPLKEFVFPTLPPIKLPFIFNISPKVGKLNKVEVDMSLVPRTKIKTRMNLVEFIAAQIDFNYHSLVPSRRWLTYNIL